MLVLDTESEEVAFALKQRATVHAFKPHGIYTLHLMWEILVVTTDQHTLYIIHMHLPSETPLIMRVASLKLNIVLKYMKFVQRIRCLCPDTITKYNFKT